MGEREIRSELERILEDRDEILVNLRINGPKLEAFIDSREGVDFNVCKEVSRQLETFLDEKEYANGTYTLEVSSPGADNELKFPIQYPKHEGRKLIVKKKSGETIQGILETAGDDQLLIREKKRIKDGKRKKTIEEKHEIPYEEIEGSLVKISFK